ncbi:hypothetical protein BC938DRAFT_473115 [Jimgerdemannia flammicorona]|uniref:G-protein coupled receptors family 3 profile domain-containing protein n=1 Tax=Jimgerdemannia flammicorona TaxID=994334 RepID=A0A433Q4L3_9FUNG|nr:hypothetical protein BC938DRAFT_473115 [Jimgerdemannia flammicorona]
MLRQQVVAALFFIFVTIGSDAQTSSPTNTTVIRGFGASFPYSVYSIWANTYSSRTYENITISYSAVGSTAGINAILSGNAQFAGTDAMLTEEQYALGGDLQMIPTMAGAVAVVYNVPEAGAVNQSITLTRQALVGIYNGTILTWNHPLIQATNNFQLPSATIKVVVRKDGSGTSNIFSDALSRFDSNWNNTVGTSMMPKWPRADFNGSLNSGVGNYIYVIQYSIGYMDYAEVISNTLTSALLINQAGKAVGPNSTTIGSAIDDFTEVLSSSSRFATSISDGPSALSYPINNWTSIDIARKTLRFIWWTYTDPYAQSIVQDNKYVPLTSNVIAKVKDILKLFTASGTVLYGISPCDDGCAHGSCDTDGAFHLSTDVCKCPVNYTNILKNDCSELVTPITIEWTSKFALVFLCAYAVSAIFVILAAGFLWARRHNPVVRAASPLFCCLIAAGVLLALSSILTYVGEPSDVKCKSAPYILASSFGLVFGMLLAKTYRVFEIFENRSKLNNGIPDSRLLIVGGVILSAEVVVVSIWMLADPPKPIQILSPAMEYIFVCSSQSRSFEQGMMSTLYALNGFLLVACLVLAFKTRRIRGPFNESHMIAFTVYMLAVSAIVTLPVMYLSTIDLLTQFALRTAIILICCVVATFFLLLSKIWYILFPKVAGNKDPAKGFELFNILGQNEQVARSVLRSNAKGFLVNSDPLQMLQNSTSSIWSFDIKNVKAFSVWKRVRIFLLNDYDLMLILRYYTVDCVGVHQISKCDIRYHEHDLSTELLFVIVTPECSYYVESKTKKVRDEFMEAFPGHFQRGPKAQDQSISEVGLRDEPPMNKVSSPNGSPEIPAASLATSRTTAEPISPTQSVRSSSPPSWSPPESWATPDTFYDTPESAPHFPASVMNNIASRSSTSKRPLVPAKPAPVYAQQSSSAVPPRRPAKSSMRSPSEQDLSGISMPRH